MGADKSDKNRTVRDSKGRFVPGNRDSVGQSPGRPPVIRPVRELAKQYTENAILMLAKIAADTKANPSARVAAIKEILDRGEGKVTQPVDANLLGDLTVRWLNPGESK